MPASDRALEHVDVRVGRRADRPPRRSTASSNASCGIEAVGDAVGAAERACRRLDGIAHPGRALRRGCRTIERAWTWPTRPAPSIAIRTMCFSCVRGRAEGLLLRNRLHGSDQVQAPQADPAGCASRRRIASCGGQAPRCPPHPPHPPPHVARRPSPPGPFVRRPPRTLPTGWANRRVPDRIGPPGGQPVAWREPDPRFRPTGVGRTRTAPDGWPSGWAARVAGSTGRGRVTPAGPARGEGEFRRRGPPARERASSAGHAHAARGPARRPPPHGQAIPAPFWHAGPAPRGGRPSTPVNALVVAWERDGGEKGLTAPMRTATVRNRLRGQTRPCPRGTSGARRTAESSSHIGGGEESTWISLGLRVWPASWSLAR